MSNQPTSPDLLLWQTMFERRLAEIERHNLAVMADRLDSLRDEVRGLRRALYSFAFSVSGGAVIFAITVFQILK